MSREVETVSKISLTGVVLGKELFLFYREEIQPDQHNLLGRHGVFLVEFLMCAGLVWCWCF